MTCSTAPLRKKLLSLGSYRVHIDVRDSKAVEVTRQMRKIIVDENLQILVRRAGIDRG